MKNTLIKFKLISILLIFVAGCSDGDDPAPGTSGQETPLQAVIASEQQTVAPFTEVTLDGSQSTGPSGFAYEWIYEGGESVSLSSTTDAVVTFTPQKNTSYVFTLRITKQGQFSEARTTILAEDDVVLDAGSFSGDMLRLYSGVNYVISDDFSIPEGKTLFVESSDFPSILMKNEAGIVVEGDVDIQGTLSISAEGDQGWKGILVNGGSLYGNSVQLVAAGTSTFNGLDEKAAVTILNGGSLTGSFRLDRYDDQPAVGVGFHFEISATATSDIPTLLTSGYDIPVKIPVGLLHLTNNTSPSNYEYIEVVTSGAGVTEASSAGEFLFASKNYYLNDGFTAGSNVRIASATLLFAEDVGMICSSNLNVSSSTLMGLDDVNWKGIAGTATMDIRNSTIDGAGSSVHNTGSFFSTEKAAIYPASSSSFVMNVGTITNSQGYGVYVPDGNFGGSGIVNSIFSDNTEYDISASINAPISTIIRSNNTWGSAIPIVLRGGNISGFNVTIPELGDDVSYFVDDHINATTGELKLNPGVSLKFAEGKGLSVSTTLNALGTSEKPITFDGLAGTSGSWKGIELLNFYRMEYCTITNGGSDAFTGQNPSNIIFGGGSNGLTAPHASFRFNHNTVSNSAGWGWQVKHLAFDPLDGNDTNTFENNTTVDSDGDGIPDDAEFPGCENDPNC